jgi:hypothetical protein
LIEWCSAASISVGDKIWDLVNKGENYGLPGILCCRSSVNQWCSTFSPFASPPGVGESPPLVNVIWGIVNFILGYLLLTGVGDYTSGLTLDALMVGSGSILMALILSWHFGRLRASPGIEDR